MAKILGSWTTQTPIDYSSTSHKKQLEGLCYVIEHVSSGKLEIFLSVELQWSATHHRWVCVYKWHVKGKGVLGSIRVARGWMGSTLYVGKEMDYLEETM